ncbi:MAG: hypothetical protein QNJ90_11105 [Planctomycetota bacterium]|nr:hypothetical protein [Planctomycetota bacterium]
MDQTGIGSQQRTKHCMECGYRNVPLARTCELCGKPMRHVAAAETPTFLPQKPVVEGPDRWFILGLGAFFAPALAMLPLVQYMGWFLASLCHEMGHCAVAWFFGMPAYPAIRIDGHAAAMHSQQQILLVVMVFAGLLWLTWCCRKRPVLRVVFGVIVLLYLPFALTDAHAILHLLAGHWAEMAFAGVFFHRALSGGFTASTPEKVTYAAVAFFLLGRNVVMNFGLMTSEAARQAYIGNGSFGLTQDFVRAARELGTSLSTVGFLMFVCSLATLPIAWFVWQRSERQNARELDLIARTRGS